MTARDTSVKAGGEYVRDRSLSFYVALLLLAGVAVDLQGLALLPLAGTMSADLGLNSTELGWVFNAATIATAAALGLTARYADLVGHRRVLIPLALCGVIGNALSAIAPSFTVLIIGRTLAGIALAVPMAIAMVKVRATAKEMERATLLTGSVIAMITPGALLLGGVLLTLGAPWDAVFWIQALLFSVLLVMGVLARETPAEQRAGARLDVPGAVGLGVWLIAFLLGLGAGSEEGWTSPMTVGLFLTAAVVFVVWLAHERSTRDPLMDFRDMDKRQLFAGYSVFVTVGVVATCTYLLVPAFAQTPTSAGYGFGADVLNSALILAPILPAALLTSVVSAKLLKRLNGPRLTLVVGGLICASAFPLMALFRDHLWGFYLGVSVYGIGGVICFNLGWALIGAAGRHDNMSITLGTQYAVSMPAQGIATAVLLTYLASQTSPETLLPNESAYVVSFLVLGVLAAVGFCAIGYAVVKPGPIQHHSSVLNVSPA